jgi:hypothetical protein
MGLIKEDSCLRKIIYFVKKNIFSASNHGFTTTATEMRAVEGLEGDLAKRTKLALFSKLPAQHNTRLPPRAPPHTFFFVPPKRNRETIIFDPRPNLSPPSVPSLNPTVLFTF